ncbi:acyltransferase family protein [Ignavigranum ruoffiae]
MNVSNKSGKRLKIFDGLKGLAILMIIFYYFFQHILPGGFLAVNTFLLIAGFFNFRYFYLKMLRNESFSYLEYFKRRLNRLFFPMLAMIITTIPFILVFARDYLFNLRNMALSSLVFLNNYFQIINEQSYFVQAANPSAFTHLWYVSLLGQLIFLTPLLITVFYTWHKKPSIAANFLLIISILSMIMMAYWYKEGQDPTHVYYSLVTRGFAYTFGGVIGLILPPKLKAKPLSPRYKLIFNGISIVAFLLLFLMAKFMYGTMPFAYNFGMTLFTIVSAVLVITSLHPQTIINKLLSFPLLTYLGKRSYSIYLWYYPIYLIVPSLSASLTKNLNLLITVQMVLLLVLSEVSYQIFEQKKISLPVGQDFNLKKAQEQFRYLRQATGRYLPLKIIGGSYIVLLALSLIGGILAPEAKNDTAKQIQEVIEKNQEIAKKTQTEESQQEKVINNIEGLNQQELLYANGLDVSFIGDSVLLSATEDIEKIFPKASVDGEVGRQLYLTVDHVRWLQSEQMVKPVVVTILGSNGTFTEGQLNDYIEAIGSDRSIFFVTAKVDKPWETDANNQLFAAAQRFGNVNVIDWKSYSNDHDEWFYDDLTHPNVDGAKEFAKFIAQEVYRLRNE